MSADVETETTIDEDTSSAALGWLAEAGAPDWMRRHLSEIRHQSAGHRVRCRDAEQRAEVLVAALKVAAVKAHGLPVEVAARLCSETPEDIERDAQTWATAFGVTR